MKSENIKTRIAVKQDEHVLKKLWSIVFGDNEADIDYFFNIYFSPELTVVIDEGDVPVSAAYILPVGTLALPGSAPLGCAMIYAIATHPECRGRGYGEAVTRAAGDLAVKKGFPAVVLKPANDGLFEFYKNRSEFRVFFDTYEYEYKKPELSATVRLLSIEPVTAGEYRRLRQHYLDGTAFIDMDERGLAYQQHLCGAAGGGLYALSDGASVVGCAVIEPDGGTVYFKELLLEDAGVLKDAVSAAAALFPAEKYNIRTLPGCAETRGGEKSRFGMIMPVGGLEDSTSLQCVTWYGPAFD